MKYYITFFSAFMLVLASLPTYNYIADWYAVFQNVDKREMVYVRKRAEHSSSSQNVQHPYFRFNRALDFVRQNNGACILAIGSSRVEALFNDADMSRLFGSPFTKLQYNNSSIEEALHNVRLLAKNDAMPQRLIIGVDDFSLFRRGLSTEINRMPPPLTLKENYTFWRTLLFRWPSLQNFQDSIGHAPVGYRPLSASGGRPPIKNPNSDLYLLPANDNYRGRYFVNEAIHDITEILSIAKLHGTKVDFFITPRFVSTYYMRDHAALHEFKRKLANVTKFYDFSGVVYENISPRFWLETSHQTSEIGLIVGQIISSETGEKFWGKLVNQENVEDHLRELKNNLIVNIDSWLKIKPDGDIHPKLYSWLFEKFRSRDVSISSVMSIDPKKWLLKESAHATLTSVTSSATITLPPLQDADRVQLSITGAPLDFYRADRSRRYIDLLVNGKHYGRFMFGVTRDMGAISNEKIITILGDFSKETNLRFSVLPEKISANARTPGFILSDTFNVIATGNHPHSEAISFEFPEVLPASRLSSVEKNESDNIVLNQARLEDLKSIQTALHQYKKSHNLYPISHGWDGLYTQYGKASENWIPGLSPQFINKLPRDPRKNTDGAQQYFYRSNGKDYKLIAHGIVTLTGVDKKYIDPRRPAHAFGLWSEDAINW